MGRRLWRLVARAKPYLPERVASAALLARSFSGDGPLIVRPVAQRVVVLAPHPDDETIACGGTIALLTRSRADVAVVFATSGEATMGATSAPSETARRRRAEARAACEVLGVGAVHFLAGRDGHVGGSIVSLAQELQPMLAAMRPDLVLLPWFLDGHPDHEGVNDVLFRCDLPDDTLVWGAETWSLAPANRLVDITPVIDVKRAALAAHVTANQGFELDATLGLNRYRSLHGLAGRGYAEAFLAGTLEEYRDAATEQRAARSA